MEKLKTNSSKASESVPNDLNVWAIVTQNLIGMNMFLDASI